MSIKEICNKNVIHISPDACVAEAARKMKDKNVGSLVVVSQDNSRTPIGIVTDRDLVTLVVAKSIDPNIVRVEDIMVRNMETARESDGIYETAKRLMHRGIRRFPVVNEDGALTGVISMDDILKLLSEEFSFLANISSEQIKHEKSGISTGSRF